MKHFMNTNYKINYYVKQLLTVDSCRGYNGWDIKGKL